MPDLGVVLIVVLLVVILSRTGNDGGNTPSSGLRP